MIVRCPALVLLSYSFLYSFCGSLADLSYLANLTCLEYRFDLSY